MTTDTALHTIGTSMLFQNKERRSIGVPDLRTLRERTGLTAFQLAVTSEVSLSTINRLEAGRVPVSRRLIYKVLKVISAELGEKIAIEDVEGLNIKEREKPTEE